MSRNQIDVPDSVCYVFIIIYYYCCCCCCYGSHSAAQAGLEVQLSQSLSSTVIAKGSSRLLSSNHSIHFLYAGHHTERVEHRSRQRSFEDSPPPHLSLETSGRRSTAYNHDSLG